MAMARTSDLTITVNDKSNKNANIDVNALNQNLVNVAATIAKNSDSSVTFKGSTNLGFAVELEELKYDEDEGNIQLEPTSEGITLKGKGTQKAKKNRA
jgi:hypothetical protein